MAVYWILILLTTVNFACNAHRSDLNYDQLTPEAIDINPDYAGAQLLKIKRCPELIKLAFNNEFNLWAANSTHVDIMVPKRNVDLFKSELSKNLIPYEVMIQDVDSLIKMHLHAIKQKNASSEKTDHKMTWTNYHRLEVIHKYMDYLAAKYPSTVTVGVLGHTVEGRPLKYCKVTPAGNNVTSKSIFVEGGIHAREWVSPSAVTYILKTLVEDSNQLPGSLHGLEYYLLPVFNPDGYEYSFTSDRLWRKNRSGSGPCLGADLNRNFDFNWAGKGSSMNPCSEIYRGNAAFSEVETKAVSDFIRSMKGKLEAYITFHSYGQLILIPYGFDYDQFPPDFGDLKRVGDAAKQRIYDVGGAKYSVGNTAYTLYPASGGADDWAKGVASVKFCYTIELRDTGVYSFMLPPQEIIPTATDALEAFKVIASAALDYLAAKYPSTVTVGVLGHTVEGRPLKYCKVTPAGNNVTSKSIFVEGGIHAREWVSPSAVTYILKTLVEDSNQLPGSLHGLEYYLLPVFNPDGYEYSFTSDRLWRKNRSGSGPCLGADLNRNFDFNWAGKGSSMNPCSEIYRGNAAFSEVETKAVSDFIRSMKGKLEAYITFHSYGQLILIPYGFDYDQFPPDFGDLKRVGDAAKQRIYDVGGAKYSVGNTAYTLYPASGGADDWAKGVASVKFCYTIELRDTGVYSFMLPPQEIIPTATDALEAFKVIASAVSSL